MSKEQTYAVLSPLLRNGEKYQPGDTVSMPPEEAERLVAAGVLAEAQPLPEEDAQPDAAGAAPEAADQATEAEEAAPEAADQATEAEEAAPEDADQQKAEAAQQSKPKKGGRRK